MGWLRRLLARAGAIITRIKVELDVLSDVRITILLLALLGVVVIGLPQGNDVVAGLVDGANSAMDGGGFSRRAEASIVQWIAFWAASVWTGLNAWYWSHLLCKVGPAQRQPPWFGWLRCLLGISPLLCAIAALLIVGGREGEVKGFRDVWIGTLFFSLTAVVMLGVFVGRRMHGWLARRRARAAAAGEAGEGRAAGDERRAPDRTRLGRADRWFIGASLLLALAMLILLTVPTVRTDVAWALGPAAVAFGAVGCIIPVTSLLIWWTRSIDFPVVLVALLLLLLFSEFNDNHRVRTLDAPLTQRPSVELALKRWEAIHGENDPIVLVATAGGASRAAYWTGTVLRALEDSGAGGRFYEDVFAISGVSGGSLGAVAYAGWAADDRLGGPRSGSTRRERLQFVRDFFGADYLGPSVAGLLFPDSLQRFLPLPLLPSRADSLEESWEMGWHRTAADCTEVRGPAARPACNRTSDRMGSDFLRIWDGILPAPAGAPARGWVPVVLLNGTHVKTGKRIITAPVLTQGVITDSYDFFDVVKQPIRASTAVHNSARFPIISPAGTIVDKDGLSYGHVVDGGYFENGGLETLVDLARYIRHDLKSKRRILIVEIINDDELSEEDKKRCTRQTPAAPCRLDVEPISQADPSTFLGELKGVVGGLFNTRDGRGVLGAKRASAAAGIPDVEYFQFGLERFGRRGTAMSWALSLTSRDYMDVAFGATDDQIREMLEGRDYTPQRQAELIRRLKAIVSAHTPRYRTEVQRLMQALGPAAAPVQEPPGNR
jgi:hypothetical protein